MEVERAEQRSLRVIRQRLGFAKSVSHPPHGTLDRFYMWAVGSELTT